MTQRTLQDWLDAGANGWNGLDDIEANAKKFNKEMAQSFQDLADDFDATFSTEAGQRVLERILSQTIEKPTWPGNWGISIDQIAAYGCYREGENSMAWAILRAINFARGGPPSTPQKRRRKK